VSLAVEELRAKRDLRTLPPQLDQVATVHGRPATFNTAVIPAKRRLPSPGKIFFGGLLTALRVSSSSLGIL
jgi:hypothetical protein